MFARCRRFPSVRRLSKTSGKPALETAIESSAAETASGSASTEAIGPVTKRRSFLKTILVLTGVPVLAGGSAVAAYHFNDDFRQLIDTNVGSEVIDELKTRFHQLVRPSKVAVENGSRDDFELARQPDVPLDDLEENPQQNGALHLRPELFKSEQLHAYLHVAVQEREDQLREEFNANLDQHIAKRLESQLQEKERQMQSKFDSDLDAKQKELEEKFETERSNRLERMATIESQVKQVDNIIHNCEEKLHQSEKAHALTAAAIGLDSALEASGSLEDLSLLKRYSDDPTISVVLNSLPSKSANVPVMTLDQIKDRFRSVSKACREAALVPNDSGILGHIIGRIFSLLLINRDSFVFGQDDISKIHRSQYFLSQSELESAVKEMDSLDGLAHDLASDWLSEAKKRLSIQQAATVLKLYAYELSHSRIGVETSET